MKTIAAILFVALMGAGLGSRAQVTYGTQIAPGFLAGIASRTQPAQAAVGGQLNGWNSAPCPTHCWTFGVASEAVGYPGSGGYLIGMESAVGNMEPKNLARKIGLNAVFKCRPDVEPGPCSPGNYDSIALWVSAQPETGFGSAIKLDRFSIADFPGHRATVLDLSDLDPARNASIVLLKLPGGREITISQFIQALDR